MKAYLPILLAIVVFGGSAAAQSKQTISLHSGEKQNIADSKLTVKFVGVGEDSRCPAGTTCVWAGNAKVGIQVWKKNGKPVDFTLNSTLDPRTVTYLGYKITLIKLSPRTEGDTTEIDATAKPAPKSEAVAKSTAVFEIARS